MSHTVASIATSVRELSPVYLANLGDAEMNNEAAVNFDEDLRDAYADAFEEENGDIPDNRRTELADDAVSVWHDFRISQAVGTGQHTAQSEIATGGETMVQLSGYVLFELAARIVDQLNSEFVPRLTDEDDA
jgi:hypothetical protein